MVVILPRCFVCEPEQVEVPFPVAVYIVKNLHKPVSLRLSRICFQLALGEVSWQLGVREGEGKIESSFQILAETVSHVGEQTLVVLLAVVAEAILREMRETQEIVVCARDSA